MCLCVCTLGIHLYETSVNYKFLSFCVYMQVCICQIVHKKFYVHVYFFSVSVCEVKEAGNGNNCGSHQTEQRLFSLLKPGTGLLVSPVQLVTSVM